MQVAIPIFNGFTALDAIGPYDVLTRLPGAEVVICADEPGEKRTESGVLGVVADRALADIERPDVIVVPGGVGNRNHLESDDPYIRWITEVHPHTQWTTSVCTGSLMLAKAGILDGVDATTHWAARDSLAELGAVPIAQRVVEGNGVEFLVIRRDGVDLPRLLDLRLDRIDAQIDDGVVTKASVG